MPLGETLIQLATATWREPRMVSDSTSLQQLETADRILAALLRGSDVAPVPEEIETLLGDRVIYHGIAALLTADRDAMRSLPEAVRERTGREAIAFAAWEIRDRSVLVPLLTDLAASGLDSVLLKGTALAYSLYGSPAERQRGDTDILVAPEDWNRARDILSRNGYRQASEGSSDRILQEEWVYRAENGGLHCVDLHRNMLPAFALGDLFDTETLLGRARPVPALRDGAKRLATPDALLHACIHRAKHFTTPYFSGAEPGYGGDRLIWFKDIDLLARDMNAADWEVFLVEAERTGAAALCLDGLKRAHILLGTETPEDVLARLLAAPQTSRLQSYLVGSSLTGRLWSDFRATPEGQSRLRYLGQILFPPAARMRDAYPDLAHRSLLYLHLHRYIDRIRLLRREQRQRDRQP